MNDNQAARKAARAFATSHVASLARELLDWQDSGVLAESARLHELAAILAPFDSDGSGMSLAEAIAQRAIVESAAGAAPPVEQKESFQARVNAWLLACFGETIARDRTERSHRLLEEALELVQACGCSAEEAHQLVDYVYGRPVGEREQEVGGLMTTVAALCLAHGIDMDAAAETELARVWTKVEAIRAKQAAKPAHSPLPIVSAVGASAAAQLRAAGWTLRRLDARPFQRVEIAAPNGYSAVADSTARNPENVLYLLVDALLGGTTHA